MDTFHFYEPSRGHGLPHDPFKAVVAPRPIGWISTQDRQGRVNLAPYSYFNAFGDRPPVVGFSSGGRKDSLRNTEETGEFVVNMATRGLGEKMNRTSAGEAHGVDEMALAGLTPAPCRVVAPPRVAESPVALECRLLQIVDLRDLEGQPAGYHLVLGQVVGVHIARTCLRDGLFDLEAAAPIMRCGYRGLYAELGRVFEMCRP